MRIVFLIFLYLSAMTSFGQLKNFNYPESEIGLKLAVIYIGIQYSDLGSYDNFPSVNGFQATGLYQHNWNNYLGVVTGFGFDYRQYSRGYLPPDRYFQKILALQVPLIGELRPFKFLTLEGGFKFNVNLINTNEIDYGFDSRLFEINALVGIRFMVYRNLSYGFFIDWGVTPFDYKETADGRINAFNRGIGLNFRYMFYE